MHRRIEDLLKVRDGEPIDARRKSRLSGDAGAAAELARLRRLREELQALPRVAPPARARARVLAAMAGASGRRAWVSGRAAAVAAVAIVIAATAAAGYLARSSDSGSEPPSAVTAPPEAAQTPAGGDKYLALIRESARLERLLAELPQRHVMNAATAGTIAGLENQIALVDRQLTLATFMDLEPEYEEALWRERVDVMNALVQVRYAQSRAFSY